VRRLTCEVRPGRLETTQALIASLSNSDVWLVKL